MQSLTDPYNDRQIKKLRPPPHRPLNSNLVFGTSNNPKPDWKFIKEHLYREGRIDKDSLFKLVQQTTKILNKESNLL